MEGIWRKVQQIDSCPHEGGKVLGDALDTGKVLDVRLGPGCGHLPLPFLLVLLPEIRYLLWCPQDALPPLHGLLRGVLARVVMLFRATAV